MFKPIIALLHNIKDNKWHPILFLHNPLPGPPEADKPVRHKSKFHHTDGFATRDEAIKCIDESLMPAVKKEWGEDVKKSLAQDLPWDGEGVPASVMFFLEVDGVPQPAF